MENQGFIKLYRKIIDWEWYDDINTKTLFIHILLMANFDDKKWHGEIIKRGSFLTSYQSLATQTGLTVQQVRTSIKKLISTNDITKVTSRQNTVIIVPNYNLYQSVQHTNQQTNNKRVTDEQQTNNKRVTTTKELKNVKNDKNEKKERKKYGVLSNVLLTDEEYRRIQELNAHSYIDELSTYIPNKKGTPYKNHYATILNWKRRDEKEKKGSIAQTWDKPQQEEITAEERQALIERIRG